MVPSWSSADHVWSASKASIEVATGSHPAWRAKTGSLSLPCFLSRNWRVSAGRAGRYWTWTKCQAPETAVHVGYGYHLGCRQPSETKRVSRHGIALQLDFGISDVYQSPVSDLDLLHHRFAKKALFFQILFFATISSGGQKGNQV